MLMKESGTYRGIVLEHGVNLSTNGCPQFVAKLQGWEKYNWDTGAWENFQGREDNEITAFLTLFTKESKPIFHVDSIRQVFDWDGASLYELDTADLTNAAVQFNVEDHEYDGKSSLQVRSICGFDDTPSTGSGVKKIDASELKKLDAVFGAALQKLSGGPKVATAPKPGTPATPKPAASKTTEPKAKEDSAGKKKKATAKPKAIPEKAFDELEKEAQAEEKAEEKAKVKTAAAVPPPPSAAAPVKNTGMTKDEAWAGCYQMKAATITDEQLGKAFLASQFKIAENVKEEDITPDQWRQIYENVTAEYGMY